MDSTFARAGRPPILESLAGAAILAVGMGFGRFAFTGMYPLMVKEAVMSVSTGSLAASANYAGYLVGALAMSGVNERHAARLSRGALVGTVASLAVLAIHPTVTLLIGTRFLAGLVSAVSLVAASVWLLQTMNHQHGAPILYAGVGVGIAASGQLIAIGEAAHVGSPALWLLLAAAAFVLSALAWPITLHTAPLPDEQTQRSSPSHRSVRPNIGPWTLVVIYGFAGLGYIVTATYLPLLIKTTASHLSAPYVWACFGLAAVPSCFLWHELHQRCGSRLSLAVNLLVQAIGVVLPVFSHAPSAFLGSAVLVGGTFVGSVTIIMPAAKRVAHVVHFNLMAALTAAYGVGQIVGPLLSERLVERTHSFDQPLAAAGAALVAAALVCVVRRSA